MPASEKMTIYNILETIPDGIIPYMSGCDAQRLAMTSRSVRDCIKRVSRLKCRIHMEKDNHRAHQIYKRIRCVIIDGDTIHVYKRERLGLPTFYAHVPYKVEFIDGNITKTRNLKCNNLDESYGDKVIRTLEHLYINVTGTFTVPDVYSLTSFKISRLLERSMTVRRMFDMIKELDPLGNPDVTHRDLVVIKNMAVIRKLMRLDISEHRCQVDTCVIQKCIKLVPYFGKMLETAGCDMQNHRMVHDFVCSICIE